MGAWETPSGDWGGISPSTMKSGRTRRWGSKRRVGWTAAGEPRRPHGGWGDFAPDERSGARAAKMGRRECPPAGTAKQGWVGKRGLGLSLFLPAGSRGKTRWVEETQSYSLKRPKFCLDIGEHLRILEAIGRNSGAVELSEEDLQLYRLAALLHDIGHYPYSHAMEVAVQNHYSERLLKGGPATPDHPGTAPSDNLTDQAKPFMHERLGKEVLLRDEQLNTVLKEGGVDPEEVSALF